VRAAQGLVSSLGPDANHQLATAGDPDRHVAVQQEREPAEHRFLGDRVLVGELVADAVREVLVVGHPSRKPH